MRRLLAYNWPGNARELRNVIERAVVLQEKGPITVESLPDSIAGRTRRIPKAEPRRSFRRLDEVERDHIRYALECTEGNRTRAANLLGIGRRTLYAKLKEYSLAGESPGVTTNPFDFARNGNGRP
jgi:DNA-binding NtrC family response regulator